MTISDEQIKFFHEQFDAYMEWFGLIDWNVYHNYNSWQGSRANVAINWRARSVTISLNHEFNESPTFDELERHAFHEAMEVLLIGHEYICVKYGRCGGNRMEDILVSETHRIINALSNSLVKSIQAYNVTESNLNAEIERLQNIIKESQQ